MSITERDFILRTIQQLGEVLSRIAGMRAAGKHDEALVEAQGCVGALLGPMRETIERLDAASAAMMLGDSARLRAYALVLAQRALTHRELGDTAQAAADQRRAVALFSSWTRSGAPMDDDVRAALASLASWS